MESCLNWGAFAQTNKKFRNRKYIREIIPRSYCHWAMLPSCLLSASNGLRKLFYTRHQKGLLSLTALLAWWNHCDFRWAVKRNGCEIDATIKFNELIIKFDKGNPNFVLPYMQSFSNISKACRIIQTYQPFWLAPTNYATSLLDFSIEFTHLRISCCCWRVKVMLTLTSLAGEAALWENR